MSILFNQLGKGQRISIWVGTVACSLRSVVWPAVGISMTMEQTICIPRRQAATGALRAALFALLCTMLLGHGALSAKDRNVPRAEEGYADAALSDGKQNYPVVLYGVARDWNAGCRKGDAAKCTRLAEAFSDGLGDLAKDPRAALGYHMLACKSGSKSGCSTSASTLADGDNGYRNDILAAELATRGCRTLGDQRSCAILGYAKKRGLGVAQDDAGALSLWDAACASGETLGCEFKAYSLFNEHEDAATGRQAVAMFEPACAELRSWGCAGLSFAYQQGRGLDKDAAKAMQYARRGCADAAENNHLACIQYGDLLLKSGTAPDLAIAGGLLTTGCNGDSPYACAQLGHAAVFDRKSGLKTTALEGLHFLRRACDLEYGQGCFDLGQVYLDGQYGVQAHPGVAFVLWKKACTLDYREACAPLAALGPADRLQATVPEIDPSLSSGRQIAEALEAKKRGQKRKALFTLRDLMYEGNEDAEWLIGSWLYYGDPGFLEASKRDGLIAIQNAASVGQPDAMKWLAYAYWDGTGVPQDREKAKNYMGYLAVRGDQEARALWRNMNAEAARKAYARRQAEFAALMERLAKIQAAQYAKASSYSAPSSSSRSTSSYTGSPTSSLSDQLARTRASNDYYAANVARAQGRSCPTGNDYC